MLMRCPKKSPKWSFSPLISFRGHLSKSEGEFSIADEPTSYGQVSRKSVQTAEQSVCRKNSTQNIMVALCYIEGDHKRCIYMVTTDYRP